MVHGQYWRPFPIDYGCKSRYWYSLFVELARETEDGIDTHTIDVCMARPWSCSRALNLVAVKY